jgi:hypothetical protein
VLENTIKDFLNKAHKTTGFGFSVGYIDTDGLEFAVQAGKRSPPFLPKEVNGEISEKDTFVLGSPTKTFSAAAVMMLVD